MRLMAYQSTIRCLASRCLASRCSASRCSARWPASRGLALILMTTALCGCVGAPIAQQIVQSILLQGADKATAAALDANEKKQNIAAQNRPLKDTTPDKFDIAFLNAGFQEVKPQIEPLPQTSLDEEKPVQLMQESKLVQVEVWSLLIGEEKQHILEAAKKRGSIELPPENEWQQSQIAIGATSNTKLNKQEVITFLIPAEIGKLHSGSKALVELSTAGQLSVARYTVN
jgi:hypothetical protein